MTKIQYEERRFAAKTAKVIEQANEIMEEYGNDRLTLRQLHYQFVSRDLYENTMRNYKKLGDIIRNGRMAGLVSWDLIEDRTRGARGWAGGHTNPSDFIRTIRYRYSNDKWLGQKKRVEVWCEKDALTGVISDPCAEYEINFFATKGYPSISSLKKSADRFKRYGRAGIQVHVLYFSDHDPEGLHMPSQVEEALSEFGVDNVTVERMGLTMDQIEEFNPPSSTAKSGSSRIDWYIEETGTDQCWELDALEPQVVRDMISDRLEELIDRDAFDAQQQYQDEAQELLGQVSQYWEEIQELIEARQEGYSCSCRAFQED